MDVEANVSKFVRVSYSKSDHHDLIVNKLYKLFVEKKGVDFELGGSDRRTHCAHRFVAEEFLAPDLFQLGAPVPNVGRDNGHLDSLLEFMYRGAVTIEWEQLDGLLILAGQLGFKILVDAVRSVKESNPSTAGSSDRQEKCELGYEVKCMKDEKDVKCAKDRKGTKDKKYVKDKKGAKDTKDVKHGKVAKDIRGTNDANGAKDANDVKESNGPKVAKDVKYENKLKDIEVAKDVKSGNENYKCAECGYESTHAGHIKRHKLKHEAKSFACPHCPANFSRKNHLSSHVTVLHAADGVEGRFTCEMCSKRCATKFNLDRHLRSHTKEKPFLCPQNCSYATGQKEALERHLQLVHGIGPSKFLCETCGKRCSSHSQLVLHNRTHTKEKPFECPHKCGQAFIQRNRLNVHLRRDHKDQHAVGAVIEEAVAVYSIVKAINPIVEVVNNFMEHTGNILAMDTMMLYE